MYHDDVQIRWSLDASAWSDWQPVFEASSLAALITMEGVSAVSNAIIAPTGSPKLALSVERSASSMQTRLTVFVPAWVLNTTSLPMRISCASGQVCVTVGFMEKLLPPDTQVFTP